MMTVKIATTNQNPPGKLADVELHFADAHVLCPSCNGDGELTVADAGPLAGASGICATCDGKGHLVQSNPLAGLKLIGFGIWERRGGSGRNVTFPARQYSVNGERRSFALLRPIDDATAQQTIRDLVLAAYTEFEQQAVASVA